MNNDPWKVWGMACVVAMSCLSMGIMFLVMYEGSPVIGIVLILIGLAALAFAIYATDKMFFAPKRAMREIFANRADEEKTIAYANGFEKPRAMEANELSEYYEKAESMRKTGQNVLRSVYQEKEKDWSISGGIAQGLAGPAAGVAAAWDTMVENARIREANAARRKEALDLSIAYQNLADKMIQNAPEMKFTYELMKKYVPDYSKSAVSLMTDYMHLKLNSVEYLSGGRSALVKASWDIGEQKCYIDGAVRAKLYSADQEYVGCAYLVLPKSGTSIEKTGILQGVCYAPTIKRDYRVVFEPRDLWELVPSEDLKASSIKQNAVLAHKNEIEKIEQAFKSEAGL